MKLATVVSTDRFDARAEKLLTFDERAGLEYSLALAPEAHPVIPGLNGIRKVRWRKQGGQAWWRSRDLLLRDQRRNCFVDYRVREERKRGFNQ